MRDNADALRQTAVNLKKDVSRYFNANWARYSERYFVRASGDVLRQRHQAILQLIRKLQLPPGSTILDLGCGPGFLSFDLARRGYRGIGLDGAPAMIQRSRLQAVSEGISDLWQYQVGDVEALPFRDESFDAAICAGVIEYLPEDENLLREVNRVLKPDSSFVLCATNKYGYTVSLSSLIDKVERIPAFVTVESVVRRVLVGGEYGAMGFTFPRPRKHRPSGVRAVMKKHGFQIKTDQYIHFTLLPAPLCTLFSKLRITSDEFLNVLDLTPLRIFGSCYLVGALKKGTAPGSTTTTAHKA